MTYIQLGCLFRKTSYDAWRLFQTPLKFNEKYYMLLLCSILLTNTKLIDKFSLIGCTITKINQLNNENSQILKKTNKNSNQSLQNLWTSS